MKIQDAKRLLKSGDTMHRSDKMTGTFKRFEKIGARTAIIAQVDIQVGTVEQVWYSEYVIKITRRGNVIFELQPLPVQPLLL